MSGVFPTYVGMIFLIFLIYGVVLYYRYTVLSWAESQWRLSGGRIQFGPVGATCYGVQPTDNYRRSAGHFGAAGILSDRFVFATRNHENFSVPLASITWIGVRRIRVKNGKYSKMVTALVVHAATQEGYFVFALSSPHLFDLSQQLSARCYLRVQELGETSESHGPADATRVTQDIYGEWHEDAEGRLFLAPDRLMFAPYEGGWDHAVMLAEIREVGAFSRGGILSSLNPFAEDLLRIEYLPTPDGKPVVSGFLVRDADHWATMIRWRSSARITIHTGRKKKVG